MCDQDSVMAKNIFKTGFKFPSQMLCMAIASLLLFNACDSGSGNTDQSGNAYVSFSIAKSAPGGGGAGNVSIQQFESVTSILITVSDGKGHSVSGDIWKNNGNLFNSSKQ